MANTDLKMVQYMQTQAKRTLFISIYRECVRHVSTLPAYQQAVFLQGPNITKAGNFDAGWWDYLLDYRSYQVPHDRTRPLVVASARAASYVAQTWINNTQLRTDQLQIVFAAQEVGAFTFGSESTRCLMDVLLVALVGQGRSFATIEVAMQSCHFLAYQTLTGRPIKISFHDLRQGLDNRTMGPLQSPLNDFLENAMRKQRALMTHREVIERSHDFNSVLVVRSEDQLCPWPNSRQPCHMPQEGDAIQGVPDIVYTDSAGIQQTHRLTCMSPSFSRWLALRAPPITVAPQELRDFPQTGVLAAPLPNRLPPIDLR